MGNIFRSKMKKICDKIYDKILNEAILDSEIIRDVEYAKREDPRFDINYVKCEWSWSFLMIAIIRNRIELIEYFLKDPNINVNYKNSFDVTALYLTSYIVPILKLFLNRQDLDVNVQHVGHTLLHVVCCHIRPSIIVVRELLLDARVDIMIRDEDGLSAQDTAIRLGYHGITNMLKMVQYTPLLRIPNNMLLHDIIRMIIEEY